MLKHLSINNYALIDDLKVSFDKGYSTITGETGAGKSILLEALGLVLGKRADLGNLRDPSKKCIVEAQFALGPYELKPFFDVHDLDYETNSILRREIIPSGKSRAFVNDTPVKLDVLSKLGERLVDVHSQHQTLKLNDRSFQFKLLDSVAQNRDTLSKYQKLLAVYVEQKMALKELLDFKSESSKQLDYEQFLLTELEKAPLEGIDIEELENEHLKLSNVEQVLEQLHSADQLLQNESHGLATLAGQLKSMLQQLEHFGSEYNEFHQRAESLWIELQDLSSDIERASGNVDTDPRRLDEVTQHLDQLNNLMKKHQVDTLERLIEIRDGLSIKVQKVDTIDGLIQTKESEKKATEASLDKLANELRKTRIKSAKNASKELNGLLAELGMPAAEFKIEIEPKDTFDNHGKDQIEFLFSANPGSIPKPLKEVASGGELSRIMLSIKSLLARYINLPTMVFDEIDSGVSGEISVQMGNMMKAMGNDMQLFSITHQPQVASKGQRQYKVFKEVANGNTTTRMRELNAEERISELAEMLEGKTYSDSAVTHAKNLLSAV